MATTRPLAVGLAGAGEWASAVHAPLWAAGPETRLAGVWSRTGQRATQLAAAHGAPVFKSFEALVEASEAIVFAVPPAVQAELAPVAAACGRAVLLEKPLAEDLDGAERVADAVDAAGVGSLMGLTYRFNPGVREFLRRAGDFEVAGARACFISGVFLAGKFGGTWRERHGALLDVGPHLLDLVQAAMGPYRSIEGQTSAGGWTSLVTRHDSGAVSELSICCHAALMPSRTEMELFGLSGSLFVDARQGREQSFAVLRTEFAETARRGGGHRLDARHGVEVQKWVDAATRATSTPASYADEATSLPHVAPAAHEPAPATGRPETPAG
jgi:predicted dehydrogenase